jgi:hypothetical protein
MKLRRLCRLVRHDLFCFLDSFADDGFTLDQLGIEGDRSVDRLATHCVLNVFDRDQVGLLLLGKVVRTDLPQTFVILGPHIYLNLLTRLILNLQWSVEVETTGCKTLVLLNVSIIILSEKLPGLGFIGLEGFSVDAANVDKLVNWVTLDLLHCIRVGAGCKWYQRDC